MILFGNYKVANELTGAAKVLDNKLLKIKIDDHNQVDFIDATTGDILRQTTPIVEMSGVINNTADLILKTTSGSVYHICSVTENGTFTSPMTPIDADLATVVNFVKKISESSQEAMEALNRMDNYTNWMISAAPHHEADAIMDELFADDFEPVLDELPNEFAKPHSELPENSQSILNANYSRSDEIKTHLGNIKDPLEEIEKDCVDVSDLPPVEHEVSLKWKPINYGDGYGPAYKVTFEEEVTEEQFIRYCKSKGWNLTRIDGWAWYEDHALVHNSLWEKHHLINPDYHCGPDKVWIYKWVRVYTD